MACCDCCCPNPEECCKSQGENGICCLPDKCCGTAEAPECCSPSEFCCEEVCCPEGYVCCEGVCCDEGQCCVDGECSDECECETDEDCEYVVVTCLCDPELDPDPYPVWFGSFEEALAYVPPSGCGACTADPATGKCCDDACYPSPLPGSYGPPEDLECPT